MLKRAEKKENNETKQNSNLLENTDNSDNSSWFEEYKPLLIIYAIVLFGIFFIIITIGGNYSSNTKSNSKDYCPNGDYSSSYYDDDCGTKPEEKVCRGSDGGYYDKPKNGYCDGSKTPQGWTCNNGFTAKSEGERKRDNDSWYCECISSYVSCDAYYDTQTDTMQAEIDKQQSYLDNMYVDQYSQISVDKYNNQVQYVNNLIGRRNRYMSENCICSAN